MSDNLPEGLTPRDKLPLPPPDAVFELRNYKVFYDPHPYCITPKHVAVAADQFGGMLGIDAIQAAEKQGASCEICVKGRGVILPYDKHERVVALEVAVPNNRENLNKVPGLGEYLMKLKEATAGTPCTGFAFPNKI